MTALITGASGVLGGEYAKQLASRGYDLCLTGRSGQKLTELKTQLDEAYSGGNFKIYPADLTSSAQREELFKQLDGEKFSLVINAAGADIQKPFEEYDMQKAAFQARICFEAAVCVCLFSLSHRGAKLNICNVSSLCGRQPIPYFAVYSAAKGALTSFSLAIGEELRGTGVKVTALIPGSIYTREDIREYIGGLGFWAKKAAKTPQYVVTKSLKAVFAGKKKYIPGFLNKAAYALSGLCPPPIRLRLMARSRKNVKKDAF